MIKKISSFIRALVSRNEVSERAEIIENILLGRASGTDIEAINAVAHLTASICDKEIEAVIDAGVFVFFKLKKEDGSYQIFFRKLNLKERALLNSKPTLLEQPYLLLKHLEGSVPLSEEVAIKLREFREAVHE